MKASNSSQRARTNVRVWTAKSVVRWYEPIRRGSWSVAKFQRLLYTRCCLADGNRQNDRISSASRCKSRANDAAAGSITRLIFMTTASSKKTVLGNVVDLALLQLQIAKIIWYHWLIVYSLDPWETGGTITALTPSTLNLVVYIRLPVLFFTLQVML